MRSHKAWLFVCSYTLGIVVFTPYLPDVIRWAGSRWTSSSVSHFVLKAEIGLAFIILTLALWLLSRKGRKTLPFFLAVLGIILISFLLYRILPNPYEFTHLPEYAVLSFLIAKALGKKREDSPEDQWKARKLKQKLFPQINNLYWKSGLITGLVGLCDEIYQHFLPRRVFTWYDILLNILGGIVGLLVFWALKR